MPTRVFVRRERRHACCWRCPFPSRSRRAQSLRQNSCTDVNTALGRSYAGFHSCSCRCSRWVSRMFIAYAES